ncbi:SDR family oxidoreductase [Conexibacter sp. SYSU D00693]|uniref:SDR family NAD(P)-dependent oxidoreductase n=1 Tax=Conexibacter sp. SYSU D00693 TaxID=2812560 RepID=UPI00196B0160|nr:SDR family oxidoreductase [Conexibacter sp. SYSU D00693]
MRDDGTALVTGASSGIGEEFARQLAAKGYGVTLVARRRERLEALAEELRKAHGVRVEVAPCDLADQDACERLVRDVEAQGLTIDVLVNNAGFGIYRAFASSDLDREFEQLAVLVGAVVQLDGLVLPGMLERGRGAIINVSSTAGLQPLPGNGTYAACKAFVQLHTEALHEEVRGTGVTVTAVAPGPVRTEFQETSEPLFAERLPGFVWASAERVARDGLRAAEKGKRSVIPGGLATKLFFGPNRHLPVGLSLPVARRLMSKEIAAPAAGARQLTGGDPGTP